MIRIINPVLFVLSFMLLMGCEQSYEHSKQQRMQRAAVPENQQAPIVIGVPWRRETEDFFIAGVKLAVKEINQKGGVLNHIPLQIVINDSESGFFSTRTHRHGILSIARTYAANPDVIAVVGHSSSESAMIASVVYENSGIVFLAPNARFTRLTGHNFTYTFRTSLNNTIMGEQLADYTVQKGYKHIAILSSRTDSTDEFVNEFVSHISEKYPTDVVYRRSFFEDNVDIISLIADLKSVQNQMDVIFIATSGKKAAQIYQQIRNVGITLPIIGNATLDTKEFWGRVKQWEYSQKIQKSNIPTLFTTTTLKGKQFDQQFQREYHQDADYLAALGYDSIKLLAHAIEYAKSRVPLEIASTLRYMNACKGVTGKYEFERNGDLKNKPLSFYHIVKDDFVFERVNNGTVLDDPKMEVCNEVDRDHDGIPTHSDACPDTTKAEMAKGINQDGAERGCPVDSDRDGVPDYKDKCFKDSAVAIAKGVDTVGCPVDFDKDGIPDYKDADIDNDKVINKEDHCPKTTVKELVYGANLTGKQAGCPVDTDNDGVLDYLDECRTNTAAEIAQGVDAKGCPVDNDFDGVLDYLDKCLNTEKGLLINGEGCEILKSARLSKPANRIFVNNQPKLTKEAKKYVDELLEKTHVDRLKQIQMIGYATKQNKALVQTQLAVLADYVQEKQVPVQKIQTLVKDADANKNDVIEIIVSEVQLKPVETETGSEPKASETTVPVAKEAVADKSKPIPKPDLPQSEPSVSPKPESSTPPTQPSP
jgi:ABC-type branched-subunit amino acid transport system substrate-binding protein